MVFPTNGTWSFYVSALTPTGGFLPPGRKDYRAYDLGSNGGKTVSFSVKVVNGKYLVTYIDPNTGESVSKTYTKIYGQGNYNRSHTIIFSNDDNSDSLVVGSDPNPLGNSTSFVQSSTQDIFYGYPLGNHIYEFRPNSTWINHFDPCFLKGTLISTPSGLVAVEDLKVGDEVHSFNADGSSYVSTLAWIGKARTAVCQDAFGDEAGYPVRILKGAIAEGVPFKDLLVTAEHCLFLDNGFIPARMLINGSSIIFDTSFIEYDYCHIDTCKHSIIMADGVLTESYLDTGNRNRFFQEGKVFSPGNSPDAGKSWEKDAAAPLKVARDVVEPIYNQIMARAEKMGRPVVGEKMALTEDANLHLKTDAGQVIRPLRYRADKAVFSIPGGVRSVRIISNTSRPCDTIGPFLDDRRHLGVLVGEVILYATAGTSILNNYLHDPEIDGWFNTDGVSPCWTNGYARLDLGEDVNIGPSILSLQIVASGPYIDRACRSRLAS